MNYLEFEKLVLNLPRSTFSSSSDLAQSHQALVAQIAHQLQIDLSQLPAIHVAGTNGKGSVCWKLAAALALSGYRVGLFTSPHLLSVKERIRVLHNSQMEETCISEKAFLEYGLKVYSLLEQRQQPFGFFDFLTLLGLYYFSQERVDAIVCEVGIGGRYDSTNCIKPLVSVITSIGYDHEELLGDNLESIAWHKAGIIKQGAAVVIGPRVTQKSIMHEAKALGVDIVSTPAWNESYEIENQATALKTLEVLSKKMTLSEVAILQGLSYVPRARFESVFWQGCEWILDVGHNVEGISRVLQRIACEKKSKELRLALGMSQDKDYRGVVSIVVDKAKELYFFRAQHPRLVSPDLLDYHAKSLQYKGSSVMDITEGNLRTLSKRAEQANALILVCGSFYFVSEVFKNLH